MKIFKVPFGSGGLGKTRGTSAAPDMIIHELKEIFMDESFRTKQYDIHDIEADHGNISKTHENIQKSGKGIFLGGDHSITYSSFISSGCDGLLVLDAHPDLMPGTDVPSHEDYLRKLVEDSCLDPEKCIVLGVRNPFGSELEFAKEHGISLITCSSIYRNGLDNVCDSVMEKMRSCSSLYLSIDIDAIDPAHAPGTNHREPAGLSAREVLHILHRLQYLKKITSGDVVEVDPNIDINNMTSRLAARIVYEFLQ